KGEEDEQAESDQDAEQFDDVSAHDVAFKRARKSQAATVRSEIRTQPRVRARTGLTSRSQSPPWRRPIGQQTNDAWGVPRRSCSARNGTSTAARRARRAPFRSRPSLRPARR